LLASGTLVTGLTMIPIASCSGVTLVINPRQMLKIKMSIDLGRGNVGMAQKFLYGTKVTTGFKHVAGKRVSQQVRMELLVGTTADSPTAKAGLDTSVAESFAPLADEQGSLTVIGQRRSVR